MKIAFALIPEKGHVNPYIGPAQALTDAGHDVVIAAPGDISAQIGRAGLEFHRHLIPGGDETRVTRGAELVDLIQDAARLDAWIEQLLLDGIPEQVAALLDWFRVERPDVVVLDPLYYPAAIAAHLARLPWASVSNSLNPVLPASIDSALLRTVRRLHDKRVALFAAYGLNARFSGCDVLSPYLTVALATEAFVGPAPPGVTLVGPSLALRNRGDEVPLRALPSDRPTIYASFGSQIYHWPAIFDKLIAAASSLHAHLVLSLGDLANDPRWSSIPHCDVYTYAPQVDLLRGAAAFVTHGGANSVMEAIAACVPLLISPMCNDQFHQAYFVERSGIGRVDDLIHAPVDRIAAHLRALLDDPGPRAAMRKISATYQVNGAVEAARRIAALAR